MPLSSNGCLQPGARTGGQQATRRIRSRGTPKMPWMSHFCNKLSDSSPDGFKCIFGRPCLALTP